jgi:hypothetical protein
MTDLKLETAQTSSQNQEAIDLAKDKYRAGTPIDFGTILQVLDHASVTLHDKRELAKLYDMEVKDVTTAVRGYLKNNELRTALGNVPKDEYEFVDTLLAKWQTKMTFQGIFTINTPYDIGNDVLVESYKLADLDHADKIKVTYADPKVITLKEILQELTFQNRKLGLSFNKEQLGNAIDRWVYKKKNDLSSDIMVKVAYESKVLEELVEPEWDCFIDAITATKKSEAKTMMKHFIWQVKRKMFGLPVKYHTMLILFGPQEAGKSTVARDYLCGPVKDFFASTNFQEITDSRNHDLWKNYVLFFDEMGRSATSNLEDIKRKITEETFNSRILTKNNDTVVVNRSTFIGTSNKDISRLIFDDSGMRRFYQIDTLPKLDWAVTQKIDYFKLWRSVDENAETPLMTNSEILNSIKEEQASKRQITMLEKWLRERPHQPFIQEKIMGRAFFEEFVEFEKKESGSGRSEMTNTKFGRDIKDVALNIPGLEIIKNEVRTGTEYRVTYGGTP